MKLFERLMFSKFMPELAKQLTLLELETQKKQKELPTGMNINLLVILSKILLIYNGPSDDYTAAQEILDYIHDITENQHNSLIQRAVAEEVLKGFVTDLEKYGLIIKG